MAELRSDGLLPTPAVPAAAPTGSGVAQGPELDPRGFMVALRRLSAQDGSACPRLQLTSTLALRGPFVTDEQWHSALMQDFGCYVTSHLSGVMLKHSGF